MGHLVLGIGFERGEYEETLQEWRRYGVDIEIARSAEAAIQQISEKEYVCAVFHSRTLEYQSYIDAMREIRTIPVLVVSMQTDPKKRSQLILRYLLQSKVPENELINRIDAIAGFMAQSEREKKPLTIITDQDLYFCLEQRIVRVRDKEINLTRKEFDLLHLLITHPFRVFTFEVLFQQVWQEEYTLISKKTLNNHMSSLNRMLKVEPDMPDYILNIHGVGYKYELN